MTGMIKEEILSVLKKIRFIVLTAAAFIGLIVMAVITKNKYWNDLTYFFAVQRYVSYVFTPVIGLGLILSMYRKKYTRTSILQAEDHGLGRSLCVISRFLSGTVILIAAYAVMALFIILLGFVLGAHSTGVQIWQFVLRLATDCVASIAVYSASLFWLYLFAFPVVPVLVNGLLMIAIPQIAAYMNIYDTNLYRIGGFIFPKLTGDMAYADLVYANPGLLSAGVFLLQMIIPLLFTMLIFKLKKLKPLKTAEVQPS
jgi:hypothetical protein